MTTTTLTTPTDRPVNRGSGQAAPRPISFARILDVELRKMFDTRSGFWLMASIVITAVIATGATIIFQDPENLSYDGFAAAIGIPMTVVLPIIAALTVTSEWSQRSALTTFTLVPSRARVVGAKLLLTIAVGAASIVIAAGVGAIGNVIGSAIAGVDPVWDVTAGQLSRILLAQEIGMLMGFTLGVLFRSSAAAIVGYFVFKFVLPGLSEALAGAKQWWMDNAGWFDLNWNVFALFDENPTGQEWAQLGVTSVVWLVIPLAIGLRMLLRSEVK